MPERTGTSHTPRVGTDQPLRECPTRRGDLSPGFEFPVIFDRELHQG